MKIAWKLPEHISIRRRLLIYLSSGLIVLWLLTAMGSITVALHEINEMADSQMAQLAHTLKYVSRHTEAHQPLANIETLLPKNRGNAQSEHNGFAIWNQTGTRLMADRYGQHIPYQATSGFINSGSIWQSDTWRYLYLHNPENGHTVAVAQSLRERFSILANALWIQLLLTFISLPILLSLLAYAVKQGLRPLNQLATELSQRDAHSLQAVSENVPRETLPFVQALNRLLARVDNTLQRERRFTSDAAHELRSPLAALKIQAEVWAISEDKDEQLHHLANIQSGIERATRLTEQLLILSRLDPLQALPDTQSIHWESLTHQVLQSVNLAAREKRIKLKLDCPCGLEHALPLEGNSVLLQLMLRNLLDNAIRYSPEHTQVTLQLSETAISVCDQGSGIAAEHLPHIKERFYRPAGQNEAGSGLGLSIVESIATLHGLNMVLQNRAEGGLCVSICVNQSKE